MATDPKLKVTVSLAGPYVRSLAVCLRLVAVAHQILELVEAPEKVICMFCGEAFQRAPIGEGRGGHARRCPIPQLRDHVDAAERCITVKVHPPRPWMKGKEKAP